MPLDLQPTAEDLAIERAMRTETPVEAPKPEAAKPEPEAAPEPAAEQAATQEVPQSDAREADSGVADEPAQDEPKTASEQAKKPSLADTVRELRAQRRQLREELKQTKAQQDEMNRKIQERLDRLQNPPQPKPDPNLDPDGAMRAELAEMREEIKPLKEMTAAQRQQQEFQRQTQARLDAAREYEIENLEDGFLDEHPDYKDVTSFGYERRLEDARTIADNEQEARAMVLNDMLQLAERTKAKGKSYAEVLYNYSLKRGYQPKAQTTQAKTSTAQATSDALKALDGGARAARTVSKGSGSGSQRGLTVQEILSMTDEEFDKHTSDRNTMRKLFGG